MSTFREEPCDLACNGKIRPGTGLSPMYDSTILGLGHQEKPGTMLTQNIIPENIQGEHRKLDRSVRTQRGFHVQEDGATAPAIPEDTGGRLFSTQKGRPREDYLSGP
jgi:hypothetical protein